MADLSDNTLLNQITPGMIVNDVNGQQIGRVNYIRLGRKTGDYSPPIDTDAPMHHPSYTQNMAVTDIPDTLTPPTHLPEDLEEAMHQSGYIRISTGGLTADRFALPRHIENVYRKRVELNCGRDALLKA